VNRSVDDSLGDAVDISVVIVNWNTRDLLKKCLGSVYKTIGDLPFEVIVVDNNSSDGSSEMLKKEFPAVVTITNHEKQGFWRGQQPGLCNHERPICPVVELRCRADSARGGANYGIFAKPHEKAGIVCGQLLNADGSKQNSIAPFPSLLTLAFNQSLLEMLFPRIYPSKRYEHAEPIEVDSAIGACMMIRKKSPGRCGFFLTNAIFFFFEENGPCAHHALSGLESVSGAGCLHLPPAGSKCGVIRRRRALNLPVKISVFKEMAR
jgi:GT2 family glycosyltransferase